MSKGNYRVHNYSSLRTGEYDDSFDNNIDAGSSKLSFADRRLTEQDSSLDMLGKSVSRLGDLSLSISKEIDTQNRLLTSLETDVENAQEHADSLTKKTRELIKRTGGTKTFCTIVVLTLVLVVLVILVIYT